MILSTMSCKDIYDNLEVDYQKVKYKEDYFLPKAIKEFKKAKKFPICKCFEYQLPKTNNKYVIYFYAETRNRIENPVIGSFLILFDKNKRYLLTYGTRGYQHCLDSGIIAVPQINAYTKHFLDRYNERFLKNVDLTYNDIACIYLSRNIQSIPIEIDESINRNIEEHGEKAKRGFKIRDGFAFTYSRLEGAFYEDRTKDRVDSMFFLYTTFEPKGELTENQWNAISKKSEEIMREFLADLQLDSSCKLK